MDESILKIYTSCSFLILNWVIHKEGIEYGACEFLLNGKKIISRKAKVTPKKIGQFVTFWRRNKWDQTVPFDQTDNVDFYLINVTNENRVGQFVIPKSALLENEILSSGATKGKRGFRVYPVWDSPTSKQAIKTQEWQCKYFIEFSKEIEFNKLKELYENQ